MTRSRITSRMVAVALAYSLVPTVVPAVARAQAGADEPAAGERARREAVAKGLDSLARARRQDEAGPADQTGGVAITALTGIAFLQSGSTTDAGPYRAQVKTCLDAILASSRADGLLAGDMKQAPMYGHGFAMLFLAEAYARSKDEAVRKRILPVLEKAVTLTEKAQNKEGGWRYLPKPFDADVSVTVGQLNGLLAAKAVGVRVSDEVLQKAGEYVASCQNDDGGFSYMSHGGAGGRGNSGLARSAAALAALQHAKAGTEQQRGKAVTYVAKFAAPDNPRRNDGHVFYGHYYIAQALLAAGGDHQTKTAAALRDELVKRQAEDGSWAGDFSTTYATAMALIALQMPDRWLTVLTP